MKLINLSFLLIIILTTNLFSQTTIKLTQKEKDFLEKRTPLKLHNELNWPPFNYNENGVAKGFSIDYMNLLAKKLGVKVEYITGPSWDKFMKMLQDGDIDAMVNISKNSERAKTIEFTSIFHTAVNAIYVKEGNENIDSLEKLKNKTIIMPKGFFAQKAIEKYYPDIKQILVKDSLEALKELSLGKADATIGKKNVIDYIIAQNNISGIIPTNYVDDNRMVSLIRIGVNKKNKILKDILEKAQKSVSDAELLELKRKWFGTKDITYTSKDFFNEDELSYIANRKVFRVCARDDIKPIEFKENSNYKGIVIDVLKIITELTNMRLDYVNTLSWYDAKQYLKSGRCDFISTVTNSSDLIDFANTTKPFLNYKLAIITQNNKPVVSSLNNILDKTIALKQNSELIPFIKSLNPDIKVIYASSHRKALEAVSSGQAYFALEPLPIASYYISKYAMKNLYISRYTNMSYSVNMAVNKDNTRLLNILNKSLNLITENQYKEISDRWTTISFETIFDFKYFWEAVTILFLLISIFAYRHYILDKLNKELTQANEEIENKTIELAKQKLLFENIYNKSADGVILINNGILSSCNESTIKILKYKENEILNKTIDELSPPKQPCGVDSKQRAEEYINKSLKDGVVNFEWVFTNGSNENIWTEIVFTVIEIEERKVIHAVIRDITNRKYLEQKLEDLNTNLERRVKEEIEKNEINTQQLIQQSRLAQMGEMISMIAHQWRQPLSAISATTNNLVLKMILEDTIDKKYFDTELKLITDYSQYLSSTIDDFRNFFKSDKEKVVFQLNDIIEKSLSIIKTSLDARSISLIKNLNDNYNLFTYPSELQQVILNLLKNAEDALIEKKDFDRKIFINTYKKNEKTVVIDIVDNGGGIDKAIIERIFDPYFSTKNKKDGTGLGLYMSKIIINEHCKGNLKVTNRDKGAAFSIELPLLNRKERNNAE